MSNVKIGIIGIGAISEIYLKNITGTFREMEIIAVCDFLRERAEKAAEIYRIPKVYNTVAELLADPEIELVLNLTRPFEHYTVSSAALLAGKHVYSEKPLAATLEEGKKLVALAKEKNLLIGGAPDTFLGAGIQTCRKLIEDGYIGTPVGASANLVCRGHESWHPDPEFYYKSGGGPMMDMGPYYLTALVNLLGGVKTVSGMTRITFPKRLITSQPKSGKVIDVEVPTHITGMLSFQSGAIGTIITTFDVYKSEAPKLEIYGSEGTLSVPDPNTFGGPVRLLRAGSKDFYEIPLTFNYAENSRGLGLADMAKAIRTGRRHRANADQTLHVLEIMSAFQRSSDEGRHIELDSKYSACKPMVYDMPNGILDD